MKKCRIENCDRPSRARNMCRRHYAKEPDRQSDSRNYYQENRDRLLKLAVEKYDPIKSRERSRKYYLKNREKILKRQAEYVKNNRVKRRAYIRKWYRKNKGSK